ncbi:MAG: hypothetical protein AB7U35_13080, partial [Sphingobium sp.]
ESPHFQLSDQDIHMKTISISLAAMAAALSAVPVAAQEMDHSQMNHGTGESEEICLAYGVRMIWSQGSGSSRLPGQEGTMGGDPRCFPPASPHPPGGLHIMPGDGWMLMAHGWAQANYTDHKGPRGDNKLYATSMAMLTAQKSFGGAKLELRSMLSLEPAMAPQGYPNLFATGETAYGEPLVDRQHPHDLFMELAMRVDVDVASGTSVFLYGGPVGEPALGPSAFMHRGSAGNNPEPPISHHWFDSTHITYGVVTTGISSSRWQIEASAFRGAEPDERRWNIETPKLDSWSVRATWNPNHRWSAQVSHGFIKEPEATHGGENEHRTTVSVHYANSRLKAMAAFSAKNRDPGDTLTAWLAEANYDLSNHHKLFARVENVKNDELFPDHADPLHDTPFRVTKLQGGYAWTTPLGGGPFNLSVGGSVSAYIKPHALDAAYGAHPWGYTVFTRLSLGH